MVDLDGDNLEQRALKAISKAVKITLLHEHEHVILVSGSMLGEVKNCFIFSLNVSFQERGLGSVMGIASFRRKYLFFT